MDSFKTFGEEKLPDRECFYIFVKEGTTGDNDVKLDSHISEKYSLIRNKMNESGMNLTSKYG